MSVANLYAPARRSADELNRTFVARENLLQELLDLLTAQWHRASHQHILLVGPRGIGKSHMLAMIRVRLQEKLGAHGNWLPVVFPQEGYGILRLEHWVRQWSDGAQVACRAEGLDPGPIAALVAEADALQAAEAVDYLVRGLDEWAREHERQYLLLTENLDRLFGRRLLKRRPEQKQLRAILAHESRVLLIGTSPTVFRQLTSGAEPMYELVRTHHLDVLSGEEAREMMRRRAYYDLETPAAAENARGILKTIDRHPGRFTALFELTGGNPRFLEMLYRLLSSSKETTHIESEFLRLLEELTPYFQHRTDQLSEQQEEILVALARQGYKAVPKTLAEFTGIALNSVTRQLGRLEQNDFRKASERYGKAVNVKPKFHEAWYNWGNLYKERWLQLYDNDDFDSAAKRYRFAVEAKPDKYQAWFNWALLEFTRWKETASRKHASAVQEHLLHFLNHAPGNEDPPRHCCRAFSMLAAVSVRDDERTAYLQKWSQEVGAIRAKDIRRLVITAGIEDVAGVATPDQLSAVLNQIADQDKTPVEKSYLAPYLDGLDALITGRAEKLDRYAPEVTKVLIELFPELAELKGIDPDVLETLKRE